MSLAGVQYYQHDAIDDFSDHCYAEPAILSIEEIRVQLYSCFTCGVSWLQDHVCLDCTECGGYSLTRPCPQCEGQCGSTWKRDLTMSHACGKSRWSGECQLKSSEATAQPLAETEAKDSSSSHIGNNTVRP